MFKRNVLSAVLVTTVSVFLTACGGGQDRQVIQNKGSDTLVNVAQAWAEAYQTVDLHRHGPDLGLHLARDRVSARCGAA